MILKFFCYDLLIIVLWASINMTLFLINNMFTLRFAHA